MQKQVSFFERHVQWFAVGLGALFLGFMVYMYVLRTPIKVTAGGKEYTPGEIDAATLAEPVTRLQREINKPDLPKIQKVDYVTEFLAKMDGTREQFAMMADTTWDATRTKGGIVGTSGEALAPMTPVTKLPVPPAAKPARSTFGRSTFVMLDPKFKPDPKRPKKQPEEIEVDKDWWSGSFTISSAQLSKAFAAAFDEAKITKAGLDPTLFMQTAFVDVELVRQEVLANGKPGKEVVVKPLAISQREPFPGDDAKEEVVMDYLDWVFDNREELLSPAFYEVKAGDQWEAPILAMEDKLTDEEKKAVRDRRAARQKSTEERLAAEKKAKRAQKQQEARARRAAGAAGGGMPGGGGGMQGMGPGMQQGMGPGMGQTPQIPATPYGGPGGIPGGMGQGTPGGRIPNPYANMPGAGGGLMPGGGMAGGGGGAGRFEVGPDGEDITVIAHDDSVLPGKTYKYKLRYRIYNPVYKAFNAAPEALTKQYSIKSVDGAWTKPVTIRPQVEFFLADLRAEKAVVDVFQWREGKMTKRTVEITPGDAIGDTGASLVDVRGSGRRAYCLLMDRSGGVDRYNPEGKNPSPRYQQLLDEVEGGTEVGMR